MNIFMQHIFWSTWNAKVIAQSLITIRYGGRIVAGGPGLVADAEKKNRSFTVIKSIAIEFVPAKQVGMDVNTIIGDVMASRNSQSIELSSSDDPTWVADWMSGASRV